MERISEGLQDAIRSAHEAGRRAHPDVELDLDAFAGRLLQLAGDDGERAGAAPWISRCPAADLYLAAACELDRPGAWDRLAAAYTEPLRAYARHRGASDADAEEIVASLPGELLQAPAHGRSATRLGGYEGNGSLEAWLSRIVDRRIADRARGRRPTSGLPLDGNDSGLAAPPDSIIQSETGERFARALEGAVRRLSEADFELLVRVYRDDRSQKEIAASRGVTKQRINYLVKRILSRIRNDVWAALPDDTTSQWLHRDGLARELRSAIERIFGTNP